mgnify:CR=1 FL=1
MAKFLSGRKTNLKLGITDHTVNDTVLQTIGKVGIGVTNAGHFSLYVDGPTNITGDTLVGGGLTVSGTLEASNIIIGGGGNTQIGDDIITRNLKATGITTLATASVSDLTPGRVVLAGTGGELEDDSNLTYDGYTLNTGNLIGVGATFSGNVSIAGTLTYEDVTNVDAVGLVTAREGIRIPYDNKMLQIGLSDDLQLYHDSQNSYIKDNGTGSLRILGGNTTFMNAAENKTSAVFNVATSVDLYNNNILRLQTTGYGVTVYDTLRAPQLDITGVSTFAGNIDANGDLDVDGHTELDNVNVSGILTAAQFTGGGGGGGTIIGDDITTRNLNVTGLSTFAGIIDANGGANISGGSTLDLLNVTGISTFGGWVYGDRFINSTTSQDPWLKGVNASGTETSYVKKDGTAMFAGNIIANGNIVGDNATNITGIAGVFASTLSGTLQTSAQPNVNSLGTLTGLDVNGHTELDNVNISGISTFGGLVSVGGTTGTDGQYLRSTGVGVTWSSFPTMRTSQSFTATEGQTTFNFDYNVSLLDVFLNGVKLTPSEYTASNGSTVVLDSGCFAGDTIDLYSYNVASTGSSGGPGPAGPSGSKGQKGEAGSGPGGGGAKGQKGEVGSKGQKGQDGATASKGQKGQDGATASKGQKGATGADNSTKGQKGEEGSGGSGTGGLFEQTSVGINTSSKVGIGTTNPMFDLDVGSYVANNVSTASTIRIIGENNSTAIRIGPGGTNNDITLIRVDTKDGTTDGSGNTDLGHSLKYMGSGSGADNRLAFWVDNTSNTAYEAVSIYNDGKFVVDGNPTAGGHGFYGTPSDAFTVRGTSSFSKTTTNPAINIQFNGTTKGSLTPLSDGLSLETSAGDDIVIRTNVYGGTAGDIIFRSGSTEILKVNGDGGVVVTGILTATSYYGDGSNLTGISGGIGSNESINTTGIITASSFYGDASNLTGLVGTGIGTTGGGTYTTNTQVAEQIDSLPLSIKTAEYALFFENASGIQAQKLMVMHDGTTAYSNESAIMFSANLLVSVGATISGGNLLVEATPEFTNSGLSTYRFTRYELM